MSKWIYTSDQGWVEAKDAKLTPRRPSKHAGSMVRPDIHFESHQLPRNWKHHTGNFSPEGKPRFSSRQEVREAIARADHNEGTQIEYNEL